MTISSISTDNGLGGGYAIPNIYPQSTHSHASAVSWGAILAGAAGGAALSLILLILGTGLGLSSVSPWAAYGVSAASFGVSTILWLTFTQIAASGMGGYLAGRLRTRWLSLDSDEVYFRDTAHGFLAWAIGSLATAALLTSVIGSIVSGGIQAGASMAGGVATAAAGGAMAAGVDAARANNDNGLGGYFVDSLFRKDILAAANSSGSSLTGITPVDTSVQPTTESLSEVTRIFIYALHNGSLPKEDTRYVGQIVAKHTGLTQQDAEKRVADTYLKVQAKLHNAEIAAKDAADKGRKASAYAALWLFISLLIGAFFASLAATVGGRQRDL